MVRIWDGLSDRPGFDLDLVLVGRASDPGETIVREVEASPLLGRRIFWFDECSDDVLGLLCGQADMLLSPNLAEGWGAPVLDALALGTPVVMSNAGTIPADLTRDATILDPDDEGAWQTAILTAATSARPQLPPVVPPTWDAAGAVIVSQLLDIACVRIP
jgi:glycosyltransferase involved in cell wall biosynthesis